MTLFVTCGAANDEKTRKEGWENYLKKVAQDHLINKPVDLGLFGSVYDPQANHGLLYKLTTQFIKKTWKNRELMLANV